MPLAKLFKHLAAFKLTLLVAVSRYLPPSHNPSLLSLIQFHLINWILLSCVWHSRNCFCQSHQRFFFRQWCFPQFGIYDIFGNGCWHHYYFFGGAVSSVLQCTLYGHRAFPAADGKCPETDYDSWVTYHLSPGISRLRRDMRGDGRATCAGLIHTIVLG